MHIGVRAVRLVNKAVDMAILAIIMLFIAADVYAAWDARQAYEWAEAAHYEVYKPTIVTEGHSFEELQALNDEVIAWLTVYGTNIDYPLVQSTNNVKYVNTSALGEYSLSGAIFLDARCSKDFSDFSSVLYGHHMEKQAMFGEIGNFSNEDYFNARRFGMLYFGGREYGMEFFAFLHCDAYDSSVFRTRIVGEEEQLAYAGLLLEISIYTRDEIEITAEDRLVLLSTCSNITTNGRDILVGRITDELHEDPFKTVETANILLTVDGIPGLWEQVPAWGRITVIVLLLILIAVILSLIIKIIKEIIKNPGKRGHK